MSYKSAEIVLPQELLSLLQEYAEGQYIYIPKREANHKSWGENTNTKHLVKQRDTEIYQKYQKGMTTADLAEEFYLSVKSIQRIVLKERSIE
ncbi:MAG: CD3324 family protein [Mobilitalea sp.]